MANIRLESKAGPNATKSEKDRASMSLIKAFKRACDEARIVHEIKERRFYEKPCEKRRRQKKAKELEKLLNKNKKENSLE